MRQRNSQFNRLLAWRLLALVLGLCAAVVALAAPPVAGTHIDNQAYASYELGGAQVDHHTSNTVSLVVAQVPSFTLTADQTVQAGAGSAIVLPHTLTNTGNTPLVIALSVANSGGDDFDLSQIELYVDTNGNGVIDPGEPKVAPGQKLNLAPGEVVHLLVSAVYPQAQRPGAQAKIVIDAVADSGLSQQNIDTIIATGVIDLVVTKGVTPAQPTAGGTLTYVIGVLSSSGGIPPRPAALTVDGQPQELVYVRDQIPANTVLERIESPQGRGLPLYHLNGAPLDSFVSVAPGNLAQVDYVGYGVEADKLGRGFSFSFTVRLTPRAGGSIDNTAYVVFVDPTDGQQKEQPSNTVHQTLAAPLPHIAFYTDPSFSRVTRVAPIGQPLYVQAEVGVANQDPTKVETVIIWLRSTLTGDLEQFIGVETGPNTGLFRIFEPWVPTADSSSAKKGNGTLETVLNDIVEAKVTDSLGQVATAQVLISPSNTVYDSVTNAEIAGAEVTLMKVTAGRATTKAEVFDYDGVTPAANPVITDASGRFSFPVVAPGTYAYEVKDSNDYVFPSTKAPADLFPNRVTVVAGSFGGEFQQAATGPSLRADLPVDPRPLTGLIVEKTADRTTAEIGDFVSYELRIHNTNRVPLAKITLTDRLPQGFSYVRGTARLTTHAPSPGTEPRDEGGKQQTQSIEPTVANDGTLSFVLGDLPAGTDVTISYRVKIGSQARLGRNRNTAVASADSPYGQTDSNTASATVEVFGGVFSDRGFLAGTVFVDLNNNRLQDRGEPGIPGVCVLLDDGTYVYTDGEGKYSLYGLRSGTHVAKVDPITLPPGSKLEALTNRHHDNPGLAFVDIKNGELFRTDFAENSGSQAVLDEVQVRVKKAEAAQSEAAARLDQRMQVDATPTVSGDLRSQPSAGVIGGTAVPGMAPIGDPPKADNLPPAPVAPDAQAALEGLLEGLDNSLGFVGLADGDTMPASQTTLRVKSDAESDITLLVNGKEVAADRLGNELLISDRGLRVREYYGIELNEGPNTIEARQIDPFGNERGRVSLTVMAPGKLAKLTIEGPATGQPANETMAVAIKLTVADANGTPITARTPVTVESSLGQWVTKDLDEVEPGLQTMISGGSGTVSLQSPNQPGEAKLRATAGLLSAETKIRFMPYLRPLVGAATVEARIGLSSRSGNKTTERPSDPFEAELRALASNGDNAQAGVRASGYFKGQVLGNSLLTIGIDTEKDKRERMFRDIQPDEYYPIYGDSGQKGYDAQSTSRLFARLDHGLSFLQWGDMHTDSTDEVRQLGNYYRSLTGLLAHYETEKAKLNAFGSYDDARQMVREFPANGTSGPFQLGWTYLRENSERVEILVRDRNQSNMVLSVTPMNRFTDYTVDTMTGELLFRQPIASRDANLNPVFIRVIFEVDDGSGDRYWVYGLDGGYSFGSRLRLGGSAIWDNNPADPLHLRSVNLSYGLGQHTKFIAEAANTWSRVEGSGSAGRFELTHDTPRLAAKVYGLATGAHFYNPSGLANRGRTELGVKAHYLLGSRTRLSGELIYSRDVLNSASLTGGQIFVTRQFGPDAELQLGVRHADGSMAATVPGMDASDQNVHFTTVRTKISGTVPGVRALRAYGEYETELTDLSKRVLAVGAEYQLSNRLRAYARHELLSSIAGRYLLDEKHQQNVTQIGIEADYMRDGQVYSEYRAQDAFNGRETQAVMGLRNRWQLTKDLSVDSTFENIHAFEGVGLRDSLAATGQFTWKPGTRWVTTGRLEGRWGDDQNSVLGTFGLAAKVNRDWSALARYMYTSDSRRGDFGSGTHTQQRFSVGAAWRDALRSRVSALGRYEYRSDKDSNDYLPTDRVAHIVSANANWRLGRPTVLSGLYSAKFVTDRSGGIRSSSSGHLVAGRLLYDLSDRWDLGLTGRYRFGGGESGFGLGAEVGYQLGGGLWLSGGWNLSDYSDNELSGLGYTDNGPYIRLRFKFDEGLLR